ncbi:MAG: DNA polymerase III subunit delta' [Ignavibacteriales bacterium]|nr:DNA polymerase III subunit delta' [Ignavibacteriales bacterium]
MGWDRIIGQHRVKELLRRVLSSGSVAHAHLFWGGEGVGKDAMAIEVGRALNCQVNPADPCGVCASCRKVDQLQHPNLRLIVALPVGKNEQSGDDPVAGLTEEQIESIQGQLKLKAENPYHRILVPKANFIKINSVRTLRREASLSSFEGGKRVFIISHAEEMNPEASNSLLKMLEEPPSDSVFILTTAHKEQLLPTILSRCQLVQFDPLSEEELQAALIDRHGVEPEQAALVARLADGSHTAALELLSIDIVAQRREAVQFLRLLLGTQKIPLALEVERIVALGDRNAVERWMKLLGVWLRDAMVLREQGESGLLNREQLKDLTSFNEKFPRARLSDALGSVETSIALVGKNGYLPLVVTSLAIDLKRHLASS